MIFMQPQIPFSFGPEYKPVEPPKAGDAIYRKGRRAIVVTVDNARDNPKGDIVLCVVWCDTGADGVVFFGDVDGGVFRR